MKNGTIRLHTLTSRIAHIFGEAEIDGAGILTKFLSTVYKVDPKSIESILKHGKIAKNGETLTEVATPESILESISSLDKARIVEVKNKAETEMYQKGYTKAKGETLAEREKKLKEKYGVESDLIGEELDDFIIAEKSKGTGTSEEEIKKSVVYQQMEARLKNEADKAKKDAEAKIKELETTYKKEGTFAEVGQSALDFLNGLNPILPKSPTVAETQRRDFLNEMKTYDYEKKDGKILISKDGKLLEDEHGNTLSYEDHVKAIAANRFEFAVNNGGDNAGDKNDPSKKDKPGAYPAGINKPKDAAELAAIMGNKNLKPADKRIVLTEYEGRTAAK